MTIDFDAPETKENFLAGKTDAFALDLGQFEIRVNAEDFLSGDGVGEVYALIDHKELLTDNPLNPKTRLSKSRELKRFGTACAHECEAKFGSEAITRSKLELDPVCYDVGFELKGNQTRQEIYDLTVGILTKAHDAYIKHAQEKPDRQKARIQEALLDIPDLTEDLRAKIAETLVEKLFSGKER